jgi:carbon storage regulator CsrA
MLILSRRSQEAVVVTGTDDVEQLLKVTVLEVRGSSVKLGFEAGEEVPIFRHEVWKRIRAESQETNPEQIAPRQVVRANLLVNAK